MPSRRSSSQSVGASSSTNRRIRTSRWAVSTLQEFKTEAEMNGFKIADYSSFYTNELIDEINSYDVKKIQAQAVAYKR